MFWPVKYTIILARLLIHKTLKLLVYNTHFFQSDTNKAPTQGLQSNTQKSQNLFAKWEKLGSVATTLKNKNNTQKS